MPRVIVVDDHYRPLMDEYATEDHLNDEHTAVQLLERLAWAIGDAERKLGPLPRRGRSQRRESALRRLGR